MKPEITDDGKIVEAKMMLGLDLNKDGENSVEVGIVVRGMKAEAVEEAMSELVKKVGNLPPWLKAALGIK